MNQNFFKIIAIGILIFISTAYLQRLKAVENKSIEIILSSDNSIYEQGLYGIQSVIDREVKVTYLDIILAENVSIENYFRDLEGSGVPMVITIGPQASRAAKDNLNKIPVVFSMVNNPKSMGLGQSNFCGVSMDISAREFFQTLKDIRPSIQKVYGFYSLDDTGFSAGEGNYLDIEYKLLYQSKQVNSDNFTSKLNEIKEDAEAFYMISDPIYNQSRFEELSKFSKENGIILMTSFPTLVKVGATFAISPEYSKIGVETGLMANRILAKESDCKSERVLLPSQSAFYLNEEYASQSGVKIPEQISERAKQTKLFSAGITLLNEDKLKPAKLIFDTILKKDPSNKAAQTYQSLVIEKMTGTRTKELLKNAKQFYESNQFSQSRAEYQKVLVINPNNETAKEGYKLSILAQSEQERSKANQYAKVGKPFDAIREYLSSLRTLPSNQKSAAELAQIRRQESDKIPEYLNQGIKEYNDRDYDISIQTFENILLIDPNEKSAREYLRLSYKKKEAIQILQEKLKNE
ncbi:ABC transporter substrate binding protein [Leptospira sp. GIMC2001]|uniref:ABC transporter substrate binding protein n=1 Tax=Leptospira sp. GIMC2001 TaxID=1513297 RepID=UPI00234A2B29|nr:ABC transporter substrate binding protein [Leptospira sp. GIMC2001]WCL49451.1 ABC transporter substrate binding protein [Leptospira sp. GIMC2001]